MSLPGRTVKQVETKHRVESPQVYCKAKGIDRLDGSIHTPVIRELDQGTRLRRIGLIGLLNRLLRRLRMRIGLRHQRCLDGGGRLGWRIRKGIGDGWGLVGGIVDVVGGLDSVIAIDLRIAFVVAEDLDIAFVVVGPGIVEVAFGVVALGIVVIAFGAAAVVLEIERVDLGVME